MLTLRRKVNQSIHIGANIVVHVVETNHGDVLFGIDAPREIPVHRSEVASKILANGRSLPTVGIVDAKEMVG